MRPCPVPLRCPRLLGPDSRFSPFVSALPRGFPGVPLFFGREALAAIDYPPVTQQVVKRCRWLSDFSKQVRGSGRGRGGTPRRTNALGSCLAVHTLAFARHYVPTGSVCSLRPA